MMKTPRRTRSTWRADRPREAVLAPGSSGLSFRRPNDRARRDTVLAEQTIERGTHELKQRLLVLGHPTVVLRIEVREQRLHRFVRGDLGLEPGIDRASGRSRLLTLGPEREQDVLRDRSEHVVVVTSEPVTCALPGNRWTELDRRGGGRPCRRQ